MKFNLTIDNGKNRFEPLVTGDVLFESFYRGRCSKLSFGIIDTKKFPVREGDSVSLKAGDRNVFYGVVFLRRKDFGCDVNITAYDQLRYLKNKDTYVYSGKRASDIIITVAADYNLRTDGITETDFVIPNRIEDNVTLIDIIENALDIEYINSGKRFLLIDQFGRLSLKNQSELFSGVVLTNDTAGKVSFFSSADRRSNRVKVSRYDRKSGQREVFVAADAVSEKKMGVLQHYAKSSDINEVLSDKANSLLKSLNRDERRLAVRDALGDWAVRGGSTVILKLDEFNGEAVASRCLHKLSENQHLMDIDFIL